MAAGALAVFGVMAGAQQPPPSAPSAAADETEARIDFYCPMDKDIRSKDVGKCPRCGMRLIPSISDPVEYPVDLAVKPKPARAGKATDLVFTIADPKTGKQVEKFEMVHEKLFHLFLVSDDLGWFAHEHPEYEKGGAFRYKATFPHGGPFRVVTDFFPEGGTPQMSSSTLYVAGPRPERKPLKADLGMQQDGNLQVRLITEPKQPLAGFKTLLFFTLETAAAGTSEPLRLEQYLGAWGHMLAASEDLIDMIHTHPFLADGGPKVQFNLIFPRPGIYKVWVQFQNAGTVHTVAFQVPVEELR
jgi:hypothetical protein